MCARWISGEIRWICRENGIFVCLSFVYNLLVVALENAFSCWGNSWRVLWNSMAIMLNKWILTMVVKFWKELFRKNNPEVMFASRHRVLHVLRTHFDSWRGLRWRFVLMCFVFFSSVSGTQGPEDNQTRPRWWREIIWYLMATSTSTGSGTSGPGSTSPPGSTAAGRTASRRPRRCSPGRLPVRCARSCVARPPATTPRSARDVDSPWPSWRWVDSWR